MLPAISFLSPDEQEQIHRHSLGLLKDIGMKFPNQEAIDIFHKAGAKIEDGFIVKIPEELVDYAVKTVLKRDKFVLYGQEEKYDIRFGKDTPVLASMRNATHVIDINTKEHRLCTVKDVEDMVRLMDALPNVHVNAPTATPQDIPRGTAEWYALAATLKNTSKPVCVPSAGAGCVQDVVKMCSLAVGSEERFRQRPFIYFSILARPPFGIAPLSLSALIEAAKQALPVQMSSGPILGMTSPVTLAGTLAQVHTEILACLTLTQLIRPGAPLIYHCNARGMDMRSAAVAMSSPEFAILKGAAGQMGRYIGVPVCMAAFLRDAKVLDAQAGFETGTVGLISILSADMIRGMQYDMDLLVDFADLVFCDEAMGALKRIARGLDINSNTLALEVMQEVGHGGSFLSHKHTLKNFRNELWVPKLTERRSWSQWEKDGKKDMEQRAREKAKQILSEHKPRKLAPEVEAEIDRIVREAKVITE